MTIEWRSKFEGHGWTPWRVGYVSVGGDEPDGVKLLLTDMEPGFLDVEKVTVTFNRGHIRGSMKVQYRLKEEA